MLDLFMLGSMAFAAGFATGWTLKTVARYRPNCHSDNSGDPVAAQGLRECEENVFDRFPPTMILEPAEWTANEGKYRRMAKEPEEIVPLEWTGNFIGFRTMAQREYFKNRGGRS